MYAPVALFSYNRIEHLKKTIAALKLNPQSKNTEMYVFQDGPKNRNDEIEIKKITTYLKSENGFKNIKVEQSNKNLGLSVSIKSGIDKMLASHSRVIILEDDIVVSLNFLEYMNDGLEIYKNESRVASIHGYTYPVSGKLPEIFFLKGADCWGWATWRRAWSKYNDDGVALLQKIKDNSEFNKFDFDGFGGYVRMLEDSILGKNDSWAVKWYASTFLEDMYTLYPGKSLVVNIGMDGSGTHGIFKKKINTYKLENKITVKKIPVVDDDIARQTFVKYFKSIKPNAIMKIFYEIRMILKGNINDK